MLWDVTVVKKLTGETVREGDGDLSVLGGGGRILTDEGCVWVRLGGNVMENGGWVIFARVCA